MASNSYDVIIIGLGAMGSAAAYQLSRRGQKVLGLDRYTPPHSLGSSHGGSRIIREAYFEHPLYVPLVQRAYECWRDLEQESGSRLLQQTGGLMIGPPHGSLVAGSLRSAHEHHLPHEELSAAELRRRFPVFRPTDDMVGIFEPRAGVLFPERCIEAFLKLAREQDAQLQFDEPALDWRVDGSSVRIRSEKAEYRAAKLLLAAGPWMPRLLRDLKLPFDVERTVLYWFEAEQNAEAFSPDHLPIYAMEYEPDRLWYGFPEQEQGIKVALHHQGRETEPDAVDPVAPEEEAHMRELLSRYMPDANGRLLDSATCMYTNTSDYNFLIDFHPEHRQVLLASPCSGHGFKFASVIGEILATMLLEEPQSFDLSAFRVNRFGKGR